MTTSTYAPVALFAYNRPLHLKRTIESLQVNREAAKTDLHVFADGSRNDSDKVAVEAVRQYIRTITGFRSINVVEREYNFGLAKSIILGVSNICELAGRVIVLEDDLVVAPYFLKYMNDGLERYAKDERVASILGFSLPLAAILPETYFVRGSDCYGWATWKRAWDLFEEDGQKLLDELKHKKLSEVLDMHGALDFTQMLKDQIDGNNNSWAIRWHVSMFLRNMLTLTPNKSLVINIGTDSSGTNFGHETFLNTSLTNQPVIVGSISVEENQAAYIATERYYRAYKSLFSRLRRKFFRILSSL